jgi:hypothetical protein
MDRKMIDVPLNHKTILLFDHVNYFANFCGQVIEFDSLGGKQSSKPNNAGNNSSASLATNLTRINKTMWTCCIESALELSRIVFDLFPDGEKLIRLMVSRHDNAINSWNENEQNLEFLMNQMANVDPPTLHIRELFDGENFINVCKALNVSASGLAQITQLQQNYLLKNNRNTSLVKNPGRIVLFTSAQSVQTIEAIEQFLVKSIEELNKNIVKINQETQ